MKDQSAPNKDQLAQFLAAIERRAYRVALITLGDTNDAVRAVGVAMARMARQYHDYSSHEWGPLFHRLLNVSVGQRARRRRLRTLLLGWLPRRSRNRRQYYAGHESPALQALDCALAALPPPQRQAFLLRVSEGYDAAQTAKAMECDGEQAKIQFSRAVIALRKHPTEPRRD